MANLTRLLSRRPRIDEAEVEDVRERTMARLAGLSGEGPAAVPSETEAAPANAVTPDAPPAEVAPRAEIVTPAPEAVAAPVDVPKPTGPKVIVPRKIATGPAPVAPVEPAPVEAVTAEPAIVEAATVEPATDRPPIHRTPRIIVTGDPGGPASAGSAEATETSDVVAEPVVDSVASAAVERPDAATLPEAVDAQSTTEVVIALGAPADPIEPPVEAAAVAETSDVPSGAVLDPIDAVAPVAPEPVDAGAESAPVAAAERKRESQPKARPVKPNAAVVKPKPAATKLKTTTKTTASQAAAPTARTTAASKTETPAASKAESTTTSKAKKPAASKTSTPASGKATKRPPEAIPVKAQPTPVIDPDATWPVPQERDANPTAPTFDTPVAEATAPIDGTADVDVPSAPPIVRRDTSLPVPRYAVVADEWDGAETPVAALAVAVAGPAVVAEPVTVAVAAPEAVAESEAAVVIEPAVAVVATPGTIEAVLDVEAAVAVAEPIVAEPIVAEPPMVIAAPEPAPNIVRAVAPAVPVVKPTKPRPRPPSRPVAKPTVTAASPTAGSGVPTAAFCPYCALALDPAPTVSRRCTRCRQRIVVKRVQGRVVYLTEAAVEVFDSERLRSANFGRWSKERSQWLKLAGSVGADEGRISRLAAAPLSEKVVESSRTLYLSTTERSYREAKRDDRWEDASRLKRDQAAALYKLAGSPMPPPADVLAMHREAVAAELRGIGKMARDAELVGSTCCSICSADDGRKYKIVTELRATRLPHEGCPKGLCHCRWEFSLRDATMVRRYLKRTRNAKPKSPSA